MNYTVYIKFILYKQKSLIKHYIDTGRTEVDVKRAS